MKVSLRKKHRKDDSFKYYLDIYNKGKRGYQFLDIVVTKNATNKRELKDLAERIRAMKEDELLRSPLGIVPKHKENETLEEYFGAYIEQYDRKDIRMMESASRRAIGFFRDSKDKSLKMKDLTETDFINFVDYLNYKCNLKGDSPISYHKRFKKVIIQATREGLIEERTYKFVQFKSIRETTSTRLVKNILEEDEISRLHNVNWGNNEIRRAFLFACYSGLGYAEISTLDWSNIKNGRLVIDRSKTGIEINNQLSPMAIKLLGEQKNQGLVFDLENKLSKKLYSDTHIKSELRKMLESIDVKRKITFYCGRHTFAIRMLREGADLKSVSKALGHKSITFTMKYLNYVDELKDKATSGLK